MSHEFDTTDPAQRREGLVSASSAISAGHLIVMPTDTVYGIAADAFNAHAVALLLTAKARGRSMPAPVLIHRPEALDGVGADISEETRTLVREFWPGALTVIVHQQPSVNLDLGDAMGTVAVRMPDDETALDLLAFTGPLAVSSANRSGQPAATTIEEARDQLAESVDVYLNAGVRGGGDALPSTIVDATGPRLRVVRQGALSLERLREVVPGILGLGEVADTPAEADDAAESPIAGEMMETTSTEDPIGDGHPAVGAGPLFHEDRPLPEEEPLAEDSLAEAEANAPVFSEAEAPAALETAEASHPAPRRAASGAGEPAADPAEGISPAQIAHPAPDARPAQDVNPAQSRSTE